MPVADCQFVWKNGAILPWAEATVHVSCHGLHYGTGVFEGIRCHETCTGPAVFRLGTHLDGWLASATIYGMEWPYALADLSRGVLEVIEINHFRNCYVRPIAFFGSHTLAVHPQSCPVEVVIMAWPWDAYLGQNAVHSGIDVATSPWRKFSSRAIPATAKACGQYLNSVLAVQDAVSRGFQEALLLDEEEMLTEGTGENLFLVKEGRLITNDKHSSILLGITRDTVLHLAADAGLPIEIKRLSLDDVLTPNEAFFTGTAAEIIPIATVDLELIGGGTRGPVTLKLPKAFRELVTGCNPIYSDWLTYLSWDASADLPGHSWPNAKPTERKKT